MYRASPPTKLMTSHLPLLSTEGQGESARLDEGENARPHDGSQSMIQDPPLERQEGQSSGHVSRRPSHRSTPASVSPSLMSIGSPQSDLGQSNLEIHQDTFKSVTPLSLMSSPIQSFFSSTANLLPSRRLPQTVSQGTRSKLDRWTI